MKGLSEEKRKTIVTKYCSEPSLTMRKLAKQEGVSICAVQNAIARYGKHNTLRDLPGRGRKVGASKPALDKKICQQFERKKGYVSSGLRKKVWNINRNGATCQGT
jgi:transposase